MSVPEAAKLLGLSRKRVFDFVKDGRLPAEQIGGVYIVRKTDVEKLKQQPRRRGKPPSANPSKAALAKRAERRKMKQQSEDK